MSTLSDFMLGFAGGAAKSFSEEYERQNEEAALMRKEERAEAARIREERRREEAEKRKEARGLDMYGQKAAIDDAYKTSSEARALNYQKKMEDYKVTKRLELERGLAKQEAELIASELDPQLMRDEIKSSRDVFDAGIKDANVTDENIREAEAKAAIEIEKEQELEDRGLRTRKTEADVKLLTPKDATEAVNINLESALGVSHRQWEEERNGGTSVLSEIKSSWGSTSPREKEIARRTVDEIFARDDKNNYTNTAAIDNLRADIAYELAKKRKPQLILEARNNKIGPQQAEEVAMEVVTSADTIVNMFRRMYEPDRIAQVLQTGKKESVEQMQETWNAVLKNNNLSTQDKAIHSLWSAHLENYKDFIEGL